MNIIVERFGWAQHAPDLVVLIGDPYQDFCGDLGGALQQKVESLQAGYAAGTLTREVFFALQSEAGAGVTEYAVFYTGLEKGFTAVETLKTFLGRALHIASETGRKKVAMVLMGSDGEGLTEALVEGALVGTYRFSDFLKDSKDRFSDLELILCLPTPKLSVLEEPSPEKPLAQPVLDSGTIALGVSDVSSLAKNIQEVVGEPLISEASAESVEEVSLKVEPEDPTEETADASVDVAEAANSEERSQEPQADSSGTPSQESSQTVGDDTDETPVVEAESIVAGAVELSSDESNDQVCDLLVPDTTEEEAGAPSVPGMSADELAALQASDAAAVEVGKAFALGVNHARHWINQPAALCTPSYLAKEGEALAKAYGFAYQAFGPKELEKNGFVGHIAVGAGSANPPRMFELSYRPDQPSPVHLVLVGKGVTFDTGGISIKPADKMHLMVGDMSGAAAVLGAMEVLGKLRPSIRVSAIIVSAENSPDGKSFRPGDILRYKNGLSVHVENTDGEGRLLLADGLIRAGEIGATHIIDIATLTGSCARALGPSFTGVMGANRKLIGAITRAGGNHGEAYWRLPLPKEYAVMLKHFRADLNNVGGPEAAATTAALFLQEFVPKGAVWAHLDIAGTFWKTKPWKYYLEGPTGTGVATLADLALRWLEHMG